LKAVEVVKDDICAVDINMGCPKHFSTHASMGSSLLLLPDLAKEVLSCIKIFLDFREFSKKCRNTSFL